MLAVQGPRSRTVLSALAPEADTLAYFDHVPVKVADTAVTLSRTGYTGDLGFELTVPEDRALDLSRPAQELVDVVRALSPHIGARAELHGRGLTVWRARVGEDGSFVPLEVQPDGGRRMGYDAWLRGVRV